MQATIHINNHNFEIDLSQPLDISIAISAQGGAKAWYVDPPKFEAVKTEHFVGDVNLGGSINFRNVFFNPHGNGTHTECVGHISKEFRSINQTLKTYFSFARVITVTPDVLENGDRVITKKHLEKFDLTHPTSLAKAEAIVIRTLPNTNKLDFDYSNTNSPYLTSDCAAFLIKNNIKHLLIDTPSVDKEFDDGVLAMHHLFWNYPQETNSEKTITELIFVPDNVTDGFYFLNMMVAAFENDATPSKPILYRIIE